MGEPASTFRLAVLNAGGRDPEQSFADGAGEPGDPRAGHPPVNYHAYAACVRGSFHADAAAALATGWPVLLLLRRDLKAGWRCLQRLKAAGRKAAVTFKEAGAMQVAARMTKPADVLLLQSILGLADGCVAPTPELAAFFQNAHPATPSVFIPTPYPVDDPRWDFSVPASARRGVLIGTREADTPSRQHLTALLAGRRLHQLTGEPVTAVNVDGRRGLRFLAASGYSADPSAANGLRVLSGPFPYAGYLREMARHRLVFQLDRSAVPGQVAGDALLCGLPCVGGDGAIEGLAFPGCSGHRLEPAALFDAAAELLTDNARYEAACREARALALEKVSYGRVAGELERFFAGV